MRTLAAVLILATVATTGCVTTHQIRRPASIAELQAATGELPSGVVYELANPIVPRTPAPAADFHAGTPPLVVTGRHSANLAGFKETYRGLEGVWVEQYNGPAYVGMPDVRAFDIRRRALGGVEGMAAGALLGALVGVANGYASGDDPPCMSMELLGCLFYVRYTAGEKAALGGVLLGLTGAFTGYLVGAIIGHTERYELSR